MKITLFTLLFTLLVFTGCGSQKRVVVAHKTYPTWYENPPRSSANEMYEIGEGSTKEEAINNALSMMIATLSVTIKSSYHSKTVENQGRVEDYQKTVSNEIKSDVKKIRISHYDVLKAQDFGFKKYLVLIKADKRKIFEGLQQELNQKFSLIDKRAQSIKTQNAIKQIYFYKESKASIANVPNTLIVMKGLQKDFDESSYLSKVADIEAKYNKLIDTITFSIKTNSNAKNLQAPIRDGLSMRKLQIKNTQGSMHFTITIDSKIEKANAYGFTLARSAISIAVKDYRGSIVGSNKLNIIGQSTQGFAIAKENVAIKLQVMVEKEGIEKVLGLEL